MLNIFFHHQLSHINKKIDLKSFKLNLQKMKAVLTTIIQVFTDIRLLAIRFFLVAFLTVFS